MGGLLFVGGLGGMERGACVWISILLAEGSSFYRLSVPLL